MFSVNGYLSWREGGGGSSLIQNTMSLFLLPCYMSILTAAQSLLWRKCWRRQVRCHNSPHVTAPKAVSVSVPWVRFHARTLQTCALRRCPSVVAQLWSEGRSAWMKYPHLGSRADCRPGRVNFSRISILVIGRSQLTSTNTDTDASTLYLNPVNYVQ